MTSAPTRLGEVWIRKEGEQTAVFDPASGMLYRLNPSALAIWELCDGQIETGEIVDALATLTGKPRTEVELEVGAALAQLRNLGLIT